MYRALPAAVRKAAEAVPIDELIARLDLDLDPDDEDDAERLGAFHEWIEADPATRYVISLGGQGAHSLLDIDHVAPPRASPSPPTPASARPPGPLMLVQPTPQNLLGAVRMATDDQIAGWFDGEAPTSEAVHGVADDIVNDLERGEAVAFVLTYPPSTVVFIGVTGD